MSNQTITRKASDNLYFHKDFHIALNYGIEYLHKEFGKEAVREYLTQFASVYYSPFNKAIREKGLLAVKEHYEKIYKIEDAVFDMSFSQDELTIHLFASPAVMHIRANGHPISELFHETVSTVNRAICRNTPYDVELLEYHNNNGAYRLWFFRRDE
ncbi:MAG: hypothetical protein ABFS12_13305 [Bacteroidota bacterium]